jgi:hypothetical protein
MQKEEISKEEILENVASAITEETINFDVDVRADEEAGFIKKLLRKNKATKRFFVIRPLTMGTAMRISRLMMRVKPGRFDYNGLMDEMGKSNDKMAEILALAVTNKKKLPSPKMIEFFLFNVTAGEMQALCSMVIKQMGVEAFLNTIVLMRGINALEISKKEAEEPKEETSPQVPGNTLEVLQNLFE